MGSSLPDTYLVELGRVTANFALLDFLLRLIVATHVGRDLDVGLIASSELSFPKLLAVASSVFRQQRVDAAVRTEFDQWIRRADQISQRRNSMTHSFWGIDASGDVATRMKFVTSIRNGSDQQWEKVTVADLAAFAAEIDTLTGEILGQFGSLLR